MQNNQVAPAAEGLTETVDGELFKAVLRGHPGGVAVITADDGTRPVALTASSVSSVSADPPLLVFSTSALSGASEVINRAESVVIHLLDSNDLELAKLAAERGSDRFADRTRWYRLPTGEAVFRGVRSWLRCVVLDRVDAGGSTVTVVRALEGHIERDVEPGQHGDALVYHNRTWHRLGEASKIA